MMYKQIKDIIVLGVTISSLLVGAVFLSDNLTLQNVSGEKIDKTGTMMEDNKTEMMEKMKSKTD